MNKWKSSLFICFGIFMITSCSDSPERKTEQSTPKGISKTNWGTADDKPVYLFTLTNKNGNQVKISNYGGTITSWIVADKNGNKNSVVIGFDSLAGYLAKPPYFGATIGRYGNRIAKGKFKIGDSTYTLATNNGKNALHGGLKGFDKVVWDANMVSDTVPELLLAYLSKDGEEGYPGNLKALVKFSLTDADELVIEYNAETDKPTPVNLTNHSYFNLTGSVSNTVLDHLLMIDADHYTPVDSTLIPTGEIASVKNTPFDFTQPKKIGLEIDKVKGGYDHNFVLNRKDSLLKLVALLSDSVSGRKMEIFTTEPGLQFYSGNFLDGKFTNVDGKPIKFRTALCLETQHFPDSPNEPKFPQTILKPGERYYSLTKYKISLLK